MDQQPVFEDPGPVHARPELNQQVSSKSSTRRKHRQHSCSQPALGQLAQAHSSA